MLSSLAFCRPPCVFLVSSERKNRQRLTAFLKTVERPWLCLPCCFTMSATSEYKAAAGGFLLPTLSALLRKKKSRGVTEQPEAISPLIHTRKESTSETCLIDPWSPFSSVSAIKEMKLTNLMNTANCGPAALSAACEEWTAHNNIQFRSDVGQWDGSLWRQT